jgi:hypothetical protein
MSQSNIVRRLSNGVNEVYEGTGSVSSELCPVPQFRNRCGVLAATMTERQMEGRKNSCGRETQGRLSWSRRLRCRAEMSDTGAITTPESRFHAARQRIWSIFCHFRELRQHLNGGTQSVHIAAGSASRHE